MLTANAEIEKTLTALRLTLAQRRASRKEQTDAELRAFDAVSSEITSQTDNPLLEQSFRAYAVLERLQALELERQTSAFSDSAMAEQASHFDIPDTHELQTFQHALAI
jgi:hypothetical protein